jgi:carbon starvation protein
MALLGIGFLAFISVAYFAYGKWVAKQMGLDDKKTTPAHAINDGQDFVPTSPFYLFAQHFSAIAAAGPIAGPIVAVQNFGWLPALVWIAFGVVFIGAVHDFTSLAISVKNGAVSVAEIVKKVLGDRAGFAMMIFIWLALNYIIIAFSDITIGSFISGTEELEGSVLSFNPGGAVAAASVFYLTLSILAGLIQRFVNPPMWIMTVVFVPLSLVCAWLGTYCSNWLVFDFTTWVWILVTYCAIASVLPVWLLLQPRGFLGGFILYIALGIGMIGLLFGNYEIMQPKFISFDIGGMTGAMFPFLFVTIACGACSGFHGIVCSGTTSKQISKESHCHSIGYGAMLAEAFVAVIAMVMIMKMTPAESAGLKPGLIYGKGIGEFLTLIIGKEHLQLATTFGAMAFSTFVFDTLDVSARLGRYLLQEIFKLKGKYTVLITTVSMAVVPLLFLLNMSGGSWGRFWILFGASNQLLAALTLLAVTVWLHKSRKRIAYTLLPMLFILTITLWALGSLVVGNWKASQGFDFAIVNSVGALLLIVLAVYICGIAVKQNLVERRT